MPLLTPQLGTDTISPMKEKRKRDADDGADNDGSKKLSKEERRAAKRAKKEEKKLVEEARARSKAAKDIRTRMIVNGINQRTAPKPRPKKDELELGRLTPLSDTDNEKLESDQTREAVGEEMVRANGDQPTAGADDVSRSLQKEEDMKTTNAIPQTATSRSEPESAIQDESKRKGKKRANKAEAIEAKERLGNALLEKISKTNDIFTERVSAIREIQPQENDVLDEVEARHGKKKKARQRQEKETKKRKPSTELDNELPKAMQNGESKRPVPLISDKDVAIVHVVPGQAEIDDTKKRKKDKKRDKKKAKLENEIDSNAKIPRKRNTSSDVQKEESVPVHESQPEVDATPVNVELSRTGSEMNDKERKSGLIAEQSYFEEPQLGSMDQTTIDSYLQTNFIQIKDPFSVTAKGYRPILDFEHLPESINFWRRLPAFSSFKSPTPIQAAAWPYLLDQRDLIGIAETGSGKTLAFGVPCVRAMKALQSAKKSSRPRAVIVSPTRELAKQIDTQLKLLAAACSLKTVCIYGGVSKDEQRQELKTAQIIVATPGRLNDLIEEGVANLSHVKYLVLDEADRMLDKGFEDAIRMIISKCPSSERGRQTSMFTATWPQSVRDLAATFMKEPVTITIGEDNPDGELRANKNVTQQVEVLDSISKEGRLRELVRQYCASNTHNQATMRSNRILVFCLYKKEVDRIVRLLRKQLSGAIQRISAIHGDMSQPLRTASLQQFIDGSTPILIATDVAARGLDIPDVKVVINFTFPLTAEDYVHRIGRTGRAGKEGLSVTLFTDRDKAQAGALVNVLRAAGQEVPEELMRYDLTVKKKGHEVWGKHYREPREGEKTIGTKTTFD